MTSYQQIKNENLNVLIIKTESYQQFQYIFFIKIKEIISDKYFRPSEVEELLGDSTKARTELGWKPSYTFDELVNEMVQNDCDN